MLKQCLNQGTSVHQLVSIVSQVLTTQGAAGHSERRTVKAEKISKPVPIKETQTPVAAPSIVRFWSGRVSGVQRAYSADAFGWWTWRPGKDPVPARGGEVGVFTPPTPPKALKRFWFYGN